MTYEGPVKCALLLPDSTKPQKVIQELEYQSGDKVSANELDDLVDIGRDRWKYKYGVDGEKIDIFSWSFKNYTPDIADRKWQQICFKVAYRSIGFLIPKKYRFQRDPNVYTHFRDEFTKDLSVFNDRQSVLAQQYLFHPRNPKEINGLGQWNDNHFFTPFGDRLPSHMVDPIHYTEGETWSSGKLKTLATQPMMQINMHEKKHGHGYWHDENSPESIMYPFVKPGYSEPRWFWPDGTNTKGTVNKAAFIWTDDDIARWEEGYGPRSGFLTSWLNYFRARRLRGKFVDEVIYRVSN